MPRHMGTTCAVKTMRCSRPEMRRSSCSAGAPSSLPWVAASVHAARGVVIGGARLLARARDGRLAIADDPPRIDQPGGGGRGESQQRADREASRVARHPPLGGQPRIFELREAVDRLRQQFGRRVLHRLARAPRVLAVHIRRVEPEIAAVINDLRALRQFRRRMFHADAVGRGEKHHIGGLPGPGILVGKDRVVAEPLQVRPQVAHRDADIGRRRQRDDFRLGML